MLYEQTMYPLNPLLKNYVHSYWILRSGSKIVPYLLPPEKYFHVILSFKNNTNVIRKDATKSPVKGSFIVGMRKSYISLLPEGDVDYLAIQFYPHGLRPFLPFHCKEITDVFFEVQFLKNRLKEFLKPLINKDSSDAERIRYIEQGLLTLLPLTDIAPSKFLHAAINIIENNSGTRPIQGICDQIGVTARQLNREFERFLGISPKYYSRIVRFLKVFQLLKELDKTKSLTSITYECEYADQAHMIHECVAFTGLTPKELCKQL